MPTKPYSYHTFLLPFIWDNDGKVDRKTFEKIFKENSVWEKIDWYEDDSKERKIQWDNSEIKNIEDLRLNYAKYQYFHPSVLDAIYGIRHSDRLNKKNHKTATIMDQDDNAVVHNYSYSPKEIRNKAYYLIEKDNEHFQLKINAIQLKNFNTGVAVMVFELENHDNRSLEAVKKINEYGRRISAAFLPDEFGFYLCADTLGVEISGKKIITDFRSTLNKMKTEEDIKCSINLNYIASFIKKLIVARKDDLLSLKYELTSQKYKACENKFYIHPIIDDRMFVCCIVRNDEFGKELKFKEKYNKEQDDLKKIYNELRDNRYAYQMNPEVADKLYSFIFIDPDGSSCQNDEMTQKLLNKHIYCRWIKEGTIHAATHHSLMCITGTWSGLFAQVVNPFLTQYVQMAILVLVQRASIINFDCKSANFTRGIEKQGKTINKAKIVQFLNLQEEYIAFQNQLLFFEVTAQEQGIEIYNMLSEALYVEKEKEYLDHELQNLYEATVVNQDIVFNWWASIFAVFSILLGLIPLFFEPSVELGFLSVKLILLGAFIVMIKHINDNKKK